MKKIALKSLLVFAVFLIEFINIFYLPTPTGIHDFSGEYFFELPFEHQITNTKGGFFFTSDYSLEQMAELLISAGYGATLHSMGEPEHSVGEVWAILVTASANDRSYYFVIVDMNRTYWSETFSLDPVRAERLPF